MFLSETWRLHPNLCAFTSALFYEGRLVSRPGLERQVLQSAGSFDGAGIWFVPVNHEGSQSASAEEVVAVAGIVHDLLTGGATWTDKSGIVRRVGPDDIKVRELLVRLEARGGGEVILATNPNVEGEATALYLAKLLRPLGVRIKRFARGLPVGVDLEYSDLVTLTKALEGRREIS